MKRCHLHGAASEGVMVPELPDLEIVRQVLSTQILGVPIASANLRRPIVIRNMLGGDLPTQLVGQQILEISRRGKFLIFLDNCVLLVINPMLAGRLRYGAPLSRHCKRDVFVLSFANGQELRYHDAKDMGKVYLTDNLDFVPGFDSLGPDADDPALTLDIYRQRLRKHRGEIKWILTNQKFVAGIGNAYADEICWRAQVYPFRRRPKLTDDDVERLYMAMRIALTHAIDTLQSRVGQDIHVKVRDFLSVHGKPGLPCPRCDSAISEVWRQRRATHFCRNC